jgi:hypothetical protein
MDSPAVRTVAISLIVSGGEVPPWSWSAVGNRGFVGPVPAECSSRHRGEGERATTNCQDGKNCCATHFRSLDVSDHGGNRSMKVLKQLIELPAWLVRAAAERGSALMWARDRCDRLRRHPSVRWMLFERFPVGPERAKGKYLRSTRLVM